jgi:hypothetical protein
MTDTVIISRACLQHVADALDQCKAEVDEALTFPSAPSELTDAVTISRKNAESLLTDKGALELFEAKEALRKGLAPPPPPSGLSVLNQHLAGTGPAGAPGLPPPSGLRPRPTVAELEAILQNPTPMHIEIQRDGSVKSAPATQVERVAWAILHALHNEVDEDKRPMSWSDLDQNHERRIRSAALAAIAVLGSAPSGLREALEEARHALSEIMSMHCHPTIQEYAEEAALKAGNALASPDGGWVKVDENNPLPHDLQAGDMVKTVKTATVLKRTNDLIWVEAAFSTLGYETMKVEAPTHYRRRPSAEQGG